MKTSNCVDVLLKNSDAILSRRQKRVVEYGSLRLPA